MWCESNKRWKVFLLESQYMSLPVYVFHPEKHSFLDPNTTGFVNTHSCHHLFKRARLDALCFPWYEVFSSPFILTYFLSLEKNTIFPVQGAQWRLSHNFLETGNFCCSQQTLVSSKFQLQSTWHLNILITKERPIWLKWKWLSCSLRRHRCSSQTTHSSCRQ